VENAAIVVLWCVAKGWKLERDGNEGRLSGELLERLDGV
jgi:hypothetical protein